MEESSEESIQKKLIINKRHKYSIEQKIQIVKEIEETSTSFVNKKYGINKKCLRDLKTNKDKLMAETNKRFKYRIGYSGVKSAT